MKIKHAFVITIGGLIVLADEFLKSFALKFFPDETQVAKEKVITLAVHKNFGIALDLPLWLPIVIILTVIILIGLFFLINQNQKKYPWEATALALIVCGALGNLFDRLYYGFTVDYLIIPATGSAFNLSDLIIITGLIILLIGTRKKK